MVKNYESDAGRKERKDNFLRTLEKYVPKQDGKKNRILLLGCGTADEVEPLEKHFGNVEVVGIDLDEERLAKARLQYSLRGHHFVYGDATNLEEVLGDLTKGKFDVVISRHPETLHDNETWKKIYESVAKQHKKGGMFLATFHEGVEGELAKPLLRGNYTAFTYEENPHGVKQRVSLDEENISKETKKLVKCLENAYEHRNVATLAVAVPYKLLEGKDPKRMKKIVLDYIDDIKEREDLHSYFERMVDELFAVHRRKGFIEYHQDKHVLVARKK